MYQINKKNKIAISVAILTLVILGYYFFVQKNNENLLESDSFLINNDTSVSNTNSNTEAEDIFVDISGAVNNPGVIQMKSNSRIKDVIEIAGGIKENADLTNINLAEIVEDESKIYIPEKGEESQEEQKVKIQSQSMSNITLANKSKIVVNINTATLTELQSLPGVGAATAEKIVEYRKQNGKFSSIEGIKNVSGIGENKFNKIKEYIKVK